MDREKEKVHEARFLSLLMGIHGSAWVALGKVANPVSGKTEKDLEAARGSIDLLETLQAKTKGNLTRQEERVLANALSTLQLNFVDEAAKEPNDAAGRRDAAPASAAGGAEEAPSPARGETKGEPGKASGEGPAAGAD
ncbi:MAG TPA: DUF1844 domain-containing protein [bacterium]|nr:DUF1844 domain-containing protein [bacterium]HQM51793.1 DUF1844 domain-containing protein [bacterium]